MKFLKLADEVLFNKDLTSNEKIVYQVLLRLYNEEKKFSYPSMEYISESTGISLSTVKRAIKQLEKLEYLKIDKRKSVNGNFNIYTELKYLVPDKEYKKKEAAPEPESINGLPVVSDCKESGVQLPLENTEEAEIYLSEYSKVHEAKIRLVNKYMELTSKQKDIIGEFEIETLREALRVFRMKKGKVFSFLLSLYSDIAVKNGLEITDNIVKYSMGTIIRITPEEAELQEALRELEEFGPYGLCL